MSKMADDISRLPTDRTQPTNDEIQVIEYLFDKDGSQKTARALVSEFQEGMFVALLFVIFSADITDASITKYVPQASNTYIRIFIKAVIVTVVFYMFSNYAFAARKDILTAQTA